MITFAALRARFAEDRASAGASPGLARALVVIGWGAVQEPTPDDLAVELVELVDACVAGDRDVQRLVYDIARLLRDFGPMLDGGLPPVEAYEPAAEEILRIYVRDG